MTKAPYWYLEREVPLMWVTMGVGGYWDDELFRVSYLGCEVWWVWTMAGQYDKKSVFWAESRIISYQAKSNKKCDACSRVSSLSIYIYIYTHAYSYVHMFIHIYIYIYWRPTPQLHSSQGRDSHLYQDRVWARVYFLIHNMYYQNDSLYLEYELSGAWSIMSVRYLGREFSCVWAVLIVNYIECESCAASSWEWDVIPVGYRENDLTWVWVNLSVSYLECDLPWVWYNLSVQYRQCMLS